MAHVLLIEGFSRALIYFRSPLLRALQHAGHEVTVATDLQPGDGVAEKMAAMGVRCEHLPIARNRIQVFGDIRLTWKMWRLFRRTRPDVLLTWTIKPNLYGPIAGRLAGIRRIGIVFCGLGRLLLSSSLTSRFVWRILRRSSMNATCVIAQNPDDLASLRDHRVVVDATNSIVTAGCGVDLEAFPETPLPERLSILMLGRLLRSKGVNEYLKAAQIVRETRPDVSFSIAGMVETGHDAIPEEQLQAAVDRGDVTSLGFLESQDLVRDAISQSAIFVLPSWHEGTPHSTLEAMSMGRPVITTDARGCRETVQCGVNGELVPVRDAIALADAILSLLEDPARLAEMGAASRSMAESAFDADDVAATIMREMGL
jgi:glycosyltransferase involved in cell wall biosynthesis